MGISYSDESWWTKASTIYVIQNSVLHSSYVACMHFSDSACLPPAYAKGGFCYQFWKVKKGPKICTSILLEIIIVEWFSSVVLFIHAYFLAYDWWALKCVNLYDVSDNQIITMKWFIICHLGCHIQWSPCLWLLWWSGFENCIKGILKWGSL